VEYFTVIFDALFDIIFNITFANTLLVGYFFIDYTHINSIILL